MLAAFAIIVSNATLWHTLLACLFATPGTQQAYQRARVWIDRLAAIALALLGLRPVLPMLAMLPGGPTPAALFG